MDVTYRFCGFNAERYTRYHMVRNNFQRYESGQELIDCDVVV